MKFATLFGTILALGGVEIVIAWPDTDWWWKHELACYNDGMLFHWPEEVVHIKNACHGYNGIRGQYQDV
jgi:hypothetical protein